MRLAWARFRPFLYPCVIVDEIGVLLGDGGRWTRAIFLERSERRFSTREIVRLILAGHPSIGIAERLGISPGAVRIHRQSIYAKLDITTEREIFLQSTSCRANRVERRAVWQEAAWRRMRARG